MKITKNLFSLLALFILLLGVQQSVSAAVTKVKKKQHHSHSHSSSSSCSCENKKIQGKHELSPWICKKGDILVYRINVFNLDPDSIDQETLRSILEANVKDSWENFAKTNGAALDIELYAADRVNDPSLFKGDRIPLYITSSLAALGTHSVEATEPANSGYIFNSQFGNGNSASLIGVAPPFDYPAWAPWAFVSPALYTLILESGLAADDPYSFQDLNSFISVGINHELKELMANDTLQNWVVFDHYAPTVANWHYAEFDENGVCTNGTLGSDGYVHLPLLLDVFPAGGIFTLGQENSDPVGRGFTSKLQSYMVDGWPMTNYVLPIFWKGYFTSPKLRYDKLGFTELPLQPYAGLLESTFLLFLDLDSGITYYGEVENWGPVTAAQRQDPPENNFPPDYNIFFLPNGTIPVGEASVDDLRSKKQALFMKKLERLKQKKRSPRKKGSK